MGNAITSENMYIFWCRNATWKSGDPDSDRHQAFNPMVEKQSLVFPPQLYKVLTPVSDLSGVIEVDGHQEPSTVTFRCYYRDPFMLLAMFTYNTVPAAWTGTGDVITGAFTNRNNETKNICVQIHLEDKENYRHIDILLDGGKITGYRWIIEEGEAMKEEIDIKFAEIEEVVHLIDIDDGFDDASFNRTGAAQVSTAVAVAASSITNNTYFTLQGISAAFARTDYHVWFNKDAGGVDPAPSGSTAIEVAVTTGQTAQQVSDAITAAITAKDDFGAANGGGTSTTITVTNANNGDCKPIADYNSGLTVATTTYGALAQDGGWSLWDGQLCDSKKKGVHASSCTLTVGGAAVPGLHVQRARMEIDVPKAMKFVASSTTAGIAYDEKRMPYKAIFEGTLKGNDDISEEIAALSSKTKGTAKFQYATNKYMQFTNAVLKEISDKGIPAAGESMDVSYEYEAAGSSVLSFSWTGNEATDPSNHINHTDS